MTTDTTGPRLLDLLFPLPVYGKTTTLRFRIIPVFVSFACVVALDAESRPYRTAAEDAARWVRASEIKTKAGITWPSDPANPKSANNGLYSGSPGVILFLLELQDATGKSEYLDGALKGADELLAAVPAERQAGLYTGIAGIGFTPGEVYRATKHEPDTPF